jgi:flagellar biosynthesis/type III secretory pathway chaperone
MSNLLKEAIVDAKALRESALKNAETVVIEKYSEEVKETLQKLLEQEDELGMEMPAEDPAMAADPLAAEDPAMDAAPMEDPMAMGPEGGAAPEEGLADEDIPLGATNGFADLDGENLGRMPGEGEGQQLTIDLGALQESIDALKQSIEEDEEVDLTEFLGLGDDEEEPPESTEGEEELAEEELPAEDEEDSSLEDKAAEKAAGAGLDTIMGAMSEDQDALIDAIVEKLTVDMGADLSGWAGRSSDSQRREIEKELAHRRSTDVEEEMKDLKKAQEELVFENNQLTEKLSEYQTAIGELKEGLQDTNLSNARLLYTNRVLRNTSLNERQKDKIAEAISNAGSVTEAKTIYDTLQSTVEAKPKKAPQSLSEAIGRRNTVLRATRHEEPASDPFQDRMKKLAGIK